MQPDVHREELEMEAEIVCSNMLSEADLITLLETCRPFLQHGIFLGEDFPLQIVNPKERDKLIRFIRFDVELSNETYAKYTYGRIFHPDFELRWQYDSGMIRVIYIGVKRELPSLQPIENLKIEKSVEQQSYYLFGERVIDNKGTEKIGRPARKGEFAEARIPRLLHYPVDGQKPYVRLVVQEYLDEKTKQVALHRFVDVKEA